jgi:hypothetical protein
MMRLTAFVLCLLASPVSAQQPRQIDLQAFKDQLGDAAVGLALCNGDAKVAAQNYERTIADLKKQIEDAKAIKPEPKK